MRNPSGRSPAGCTLIGILAMLAAPADAVRCVTPTCQCEALKAVYSDLQISDIHTGFPGTEADCCKLSDVRCNDAGGITDLKLRGGTSTPSGVIPLESLKGLVELNRLDLGKDSSSSISGTIPGSLATVGNLRDLTLTAKRLSGTLPAELLGADAKGRLEELKVTGRISGTVPASYCESPSPKQGESKEYGMLQDLELGDNEHLSGTLSWSCFTQQYLEELRLDSTALSGTLPQFVDLPRIEEVDLSETKLSGTVPGRLCGKPGADPSPLQLLKLSRIEDLSGTMPEQCFKLANLKELNLKRTRVAGTLPRDMDLRQIEVIDFSNSGLSGTISDGLRRSKSLRFLELSRAGVSGTVPSFLNSLSLDGPGASCRLVDGTHSGNFQCPLPMDVPSCTRIYGQEIDCEYDYASPPPPPPRGFDGLDDLSPGMMALLLLFCLSGAGAAVHLVRRSLAPRKSIAEAAAMALEMQVGDIKVVK